METSARREGEFQNLLMYDYCHKHQQQYDRRKKKIKKTINQPKQNSKKKKKQKNRKKKSKKPEVQVVPFKISRKQNEISSRPSFSSKRKGEGVQGWGGHGAGPAGGSVGPPLLLPPRGGKHQEPGCAAWASAPECQQPQRSHTRVVQWGGLPPPSGFITPY